MDAPTNVKPGAQTGPQPDARPAVAGQLRGALLVIAAATLWGFSGTAAKAIFNRAIDPLVLVEARLIIASLLLCGFLLVTDRAAIRVARSDIVYFAILGTVLALTQATYFYAISETSVSVAVFLQYLAPLLMAAYFGLTGREPVTVRLVIAVAAASAGGLLMVLGGSGIAHISVRGIASGLTSALCLSFYTIYGRRGTRRYGAPTTLLYAMSFGAVFWSLIIHPWRAFHAGLAPATWLFYIYISVFATALPFTLYFGGLRHLPATRTGIIATLEPVIAAITSWAFLGESLRLTQIAGAVMVAAAVLTASGRSAPPSPSEAAPFAAE